MAVSEKKRASNDKWDAAHLKRLSLAMPLEEWEEMQAAIQKSGRKQNAFIRDAIKEKIERQ